MEKLTRKLAEELRKEYHFLMTCRGICLRHKAIKPGYSGRYISGQKRCQICSIFIIWEGFFCPCCGYRLRTRPRYRKYKLKLGQMQSKKKSLTNVPGINAMLKKG